MTSLPPVLVTQKTVRENRFSKHDNRHAFQNSGVYFGQGLGKKLVDRGRNQHISENHTSWSMVSNTRSTYGSDFHGRPRVSLTISASSELPKLCQEGNSLVNKFHIFSKKTFHRFPHTHRTTGQPLPPPLSRLAPWFPHEHPQGDDGTVSTPLAVLAESQRPFLPQNPWVYSYKS